MSETTSEQLAEIDRDMADIERQVAELVEEAQQADYPQPEPVQVCEGRWRTRRGAVKNIRPCEPLRGAHFVWPWTDGFMTFQDNGRHLAAVSDNDLVEYLGPIEPQPQPVQVQIREGRWRTRGGAIRNVTPTPQSDGRAAAFPWWDAAYRQTWKQNGRYHFGCEESPLDLLTYLGPLEEDKTQEPPEYTPPEGWRVLAVGEVLQEGDVWVTKEGESRPTKRIGERVNDELYIRCDPIEQQTEPEPEPQSQSQPVSDADQQIKLLEQANHNLAGTIGRLQARSNELEKLVTDLRTINEAQEKTIRLAGQENTDLKHRLDVVSAEWAEQSETVRKLRIELDAAQQVPQAVSDRFEEGWEAGAAWAVETIAEWTETIRTCGSQALATAVISNLPHIMRSLTGLEDEGIE